MLSFARQEDGTLERDFQMRSIRAGGHFVLCYRVLYRTNDTGIGRLHFTFGQWRVNCGLVHESDDQFSVHSLALRFWNETRTFRRF